MLCCLAITRVQWRPCQLPLWLPAVIKRVAERSPCVCPSPLLYITITNLHQLCSSCMDTVLPISAAINQFLTPAPASPATQRAWNLINPALETHLQMTGRGVWVGVCHRWDNKWFGAAWKFVNLITSSRIFWWHQQASKKTASMDLCSASVKAHMATRAHTQCECESSEVTLWYLQSF